MATITYCFCWIYNLIALQAAHNDIIPVVPPLMTNFNPIGNYQKRPLNPFLLSCGSTIFFWVGNFFRAIWNILLMEEILLQLRLVVNPIIFRVLYIPGGGSGFLPSTVLNWNRYNVITKNTDFQLRKNILDYLDNMWSFRGLQGISDPPRCWGPSSFSSRTCGRKVADDWLVDLDVFRLA